MSRDLLALVSSLSPQIAKTSYRIETVAQIQRQ